MCHNRLVFCAHLTDKVKQRTVCGHNTDIAIISWGLISILQPHDVSNLLILVCLICRIKSRGWVIGPINRCVLYASIYIWFTINGYCSATVATPHYIHYCQCFRSRPVQCVSVTTTIPRPALHHSPPSPHPYLPPVKLWQWCLIVFTGHHR